MTRNSTSAHTWTSTRLERSGGTRAGARGDHHSNSTNGRDATIQEGAGAIDAVFPPRKRIPCAPSRRGLYICLYTTRINTGEASSDHLPSTTRAPRPILTRAKSNNHRFAIAREEGSWALAGARGRNGRTVRSFHSSRVSNHLGPGTVPVADRQALHYSRSLLESARSACLRTVRGVESRAVRQLSQADLHLATVRCSISRGLIHVARSLT